MILVTHHVEEIVPGLKNVLVVHRGKVVKQGKTSDVLNAETLGVIYGRQPQQLVENQGRFCRDARPRIPNPPAALGACAAVNRSSRSLREHRGE